MIIRVGSKPRGSELKPRLSSSLCLPSLISQFQGLGSKMLVYTVSQGGAMVLARAELLQRRVTRSLQLLSSPHNNPDFRSPKPSPNDLLMIMCAMGGSLSQLLSLWKNTLGPSLQHRDIQDPCNTLQQGALWSEPLTGPHLTSYPNEMKENL